MGLGAEIYACFKYHRGALGANQPPRLNCSLPKHSSPGCNPLSTKDDVIGPWQGKIILLFVARMGLQGSSMYWLSGWIWIRKLISFLTFLAV